MGAVAGAHVTIPGVKRHALGFLRLGVWMDTLVWHHLAFYDVSRAGRLYRFDEDDNA